MNKEKYVGYIQLALSQAMVGANIVIAKSLTGNIPLFLLLTLRFMVGSLILFCIIIFYRYQIFFDNNGKRLQKKDWGILVIQALCAGFLFNAFLLLGLRYSNAAAAGIVSSVIPAVIALLSFLLLREKLTSRRIIAILFSVIGLVALNLDKTNLTDFHYSSSYGDLFLLIAIFPEALFTVIAKWHKSNLNPMVISFIINLVNVVLFLPFGVSALITNKVIFNLNNIFLIMLYGLIGGALAFIFFYKGLEKCAASVVALFTALIPISTIILAHFMLNETINSYEFIAGAFVILAIVLGTANFRIKTTLNI